MSVSEVFEKLNAAEKFDKVERRIGKNGVIASYYEEYGEWIMEVEGAREPCELPDKSLKFWWACRRSAQAMSNCCRIWEIDEYEQQKVKDVIKTNLCRNRFCENCQNVLSIKRDRKYAPYLDLLLKEYDVYFITFTVPNCYGEELQGVLEKMFYHFGYVTRVFSGNTKIKGYDFQKYGFLGAVRALEITKNEMENTFHPHFHCLFVLRKGLRLSDGSKRKYINRFSFDNPDVKKPHRAKQEGGMVRKFTEFEILLQKLWRLRYDGVKVTEKSIAELKEGYSVVCEACSATSGNRYKDVFKYATKGIFKSSNEEEILFGSYDFKALLPALYGRRVIQGYGLLNALEFEVSEKESAEQEQNYLKILSKLREVEAPKRTFAYLSEIRKELERKTTTYISKSSLHELTAEDYET